MNQQPNSNRSSARPPLTPEQQRARARRRAAREKARRRQRLLLLAVIALALALLAGLIVHLLENGKQSPDSPASAQPAASALSQPVSSAVQSEPVSSAPVAASTPEPSPVVSAPTDSAPTSQPPSGTPAVQQEDWQMRLVNASHPLPDDFEPQLATLANGLQFDARAIDALEQMLADGNAQGLQLMVCSAYRSIERQDYLFNSMLQDYMSKGYSEADAYAITSTIRTPHACSEHSSGLAADIVAVTYQMLDDGFAATAEGQWLAAHAVEYGFILRYPADKEEVTGIIYEPWHFRYVGTDNAAKISASGLCLEEYLGATG